MLFEFSINIRLFLVLQYRLKIYEIITGFYINLLHLVRVLIFGSESHEEWKVFDIIVIDNYCLSIMYLMFVQKDIVNGESLVRKQLYAKKLESEHQKYFYFIIIFI